jgi:hypothetical protein
MVVFVLSDVLIYINTYVKTTRIRMATPPGLDNQTKPLSCTEVIALPTYYIGLYFLAAGLLIYQS